MSLLTIFTIVVTVSLLGIGYVLWLIQKDAQSKDNFVQKLAPEEIKQFDDTGTITSGKEQIPAIPKPEKKASLLSKLKAGKAKKKKDLALDDISTDLPDIKPPKKSNKFTELISSKLKMGKKKVNPQDDIPQPTSFEHLSKHTESESTATRSENESSEDDKRPNLSEDLTGTASMTTKNPDNPTSAADEQVSIQDSIESHKTQNANTLESEASDRLDELKEKYEKLDSMFKEKSQELEKADLSLNNEMKNRDDFNKLKSILESEIKTVKDRAKELHQSLKNAKMETEQQKIQAQQLKDKVTDLEDTLYEKDRILDELKQRNPPKTTQTNEPNIPITKNDPFKKDIRTETSGVVELTQDEDSAETTSDIPLNQIPELTGDPKDNPQEEEKKD